MISFLALKAERDICWDFGSPNPVFRVPAAGYYRTVSVDPFPAYAHNMELVKHEAEVTAGTFPIKQQVTFVAIDREFLERTNGWTSIEHDYGTNEMPKPWSATIVLSGKRIPIHPAMTRYLVSHEYGHAVAEHLRKTHGALTDENKLYQEYRALRGMPDDPESYGGGWHASVSELFANDFRILVAGSETEFWPHPGFARPEDVPQVVEFWKCETELAQQEAGTKCAL